MTPTRIISIISIYLLACVGWTILGTVTEYRSSTFIDRLGRSVTSLWGKPLEQKAPSFSVKIPGSDQLRWMMATRNDVEVSLDLEFRKKGLIWYSTYENSFNGSYEICNNEEVAQKIRFHFDFPAPGATYDEFSLKIDNENIMTPIDTHRGITEMLELAPGKTAVFKVHYKTRGLDRWLYSFDRNTGRVQNFTLRAKTNFPGIDYPDGSLSPMSVRGDENGRELVWKATDLISSQNIGIKTPQRLNPGPLASRITFFAPVCLIFFFTLVAAINIVRQVNIHPMHYLFVAAGFFAFNLLFAYLVDHVDVHLAFTVSAVTSVVLVTTYLNAALGERFPAIVAIVGQTFFLVLFSYSFFIEGATGLTVAVGSVLTLAVLMKVTVSVNWHDFFNPDPDRIMCKEA